MMKHLICLVLILSFISCSKGGSFSSENSVSTNNDQSLPVLDTEYRPQGLSDKLIVQNQLTHAPMDFFQQKLTLVFDAINATVTGHSVIQFKLKHSARPYFELQGSLKNIVINDEKTTATAITDPDGQSQSYWSIDQEVLKDQIHQLEFDYELPSSRVSFVDGGVRFLTDMTDLSGKFFEYWGPVGFEEDAFEMSLTLKLINGSSSHKLYTNGDMTSMSTKEWEILFPQYFSKSSFYVHLTNQSLPSKKLVYQGQEKEIPIEVYGVTTALVNAAVAELPKLFKELESDYGPYPHNKFLAYMNDRSGGMEYVAATITSVASIDHELLHSWFARSVIPADGRSGWIDEAMASWRDYGYQRASTTLNRAATNLANYSPFRKSTPRNSYVDGRNLFAELDLQFAPLGGLKHVMRAFFSQYKNQVVNNEEFWHFLELYSGMDLSAFVDRYALGKSGLTGALESKIGLEAFEHSKHPTPLTEAEVLRLR